ncbi:hypothetical protein B2D07_01300 [Desulfococcus multivorans]|nr:uncharacterized protein Dmul_02600 [Desulfococcus multivorans]AQU99551.1 hypothetical protein B2D07_01300 [Desulfococcus multivorans]
MLQPLTVAFKQRFDFQRILTMPYHLTGVAGKRRFRKDPDGDGRKRQPREISLQKGITIKPCR